MIFRVAALAKVNLFLHVGLPREDGRHPLDSLVVFADSAAADRVSFEPTAPGAPFTLERLPELDWPVESDFILRAAEGLRAVVPELSGGHFHLEKRLPVASGLGGGTADGVAALRLLAAAHPQLDLSAACEAVARQLGGDGAACWLGQTCRMQGDGDRVQPVVLSRRLSALLVNPNTDCPTGPVYRQFDALGMGQRFSDADVWPEFDGLTAQGLFHWLDGRRNDLSPAALAVCPAIGLVLEALVQMPGVRLLRLSGSGATCFALFETPAAAHVMAGFIAQEHPDWWVRACELNVGAPPVVRVR